MTAVAAGWAAARRQLSGWTVAALLLAALLLAPFALLGWHLLAQDAPAWAHLARHLLPGHAATTALLCLGVAAVTLALGVPAAWLTAVTEFPGRRLFAWALLLPLALPTYLAAFAWTGLLDYTGPVERLLRALLPGHTGAVLPFSVMSLPGAMIVLGSVLYPYVYLMTRVSFAAQAPLVLELARSHGYRPWRACLKVALPLARPALAGGVALALMETLNDLGAVQHLGVPTLTAAIFRAWFGHHDLASAARLGGCLLLAVGLLLGLERWQRGRGRHTVAARPGRTTRLALRGWRAGAALGCCLVPLALGFLAPVGMLLGWAAQTWRGSLTPAFLRQAGHSLGLALAAAIAITLAALVLRYTERLYPARRWRLLVLASSLGYAVPGAVIAVGVLIASLLADRFLSATQQVLSGSLVALTGAYAVRFMAVGSQTLGAGFAAAGRSHHEAARSLGCGPLATLWRVELPLLRAPLLAAVLLLTVELLKELPLTLILRPFNFETLATAIYRQAGEERVAEAAVPALLLLLAGLLPILLLHRLTLREAPCTCNSKS